MAKDIRKSSRYNQIGGNGSFASLSRGNFVAPAYSIHQKVFEKISLLDKLA